MELWGKGVRAEVAVEVEVEMGVGVGVGVDVRRTKGIEKETIGGALQESESVPLGFALLDHGLFDTYARYDRCQSTVKKPGPTPSRTLIT